MSTVTVDGTIGPGQAVSALVMQNIASFSFEANQTLRLTDTSGHVTIFDISSAVTITVTVSSGVYTVTIADS